MTLQNVIKTLTTKIGFMHDQTMGLEDKLLEKKTEIHRLKRCKNYSYSSQTSLSLKNNNAKSRGASTTASAKSSGVTAREKAC